MGAIERAENSKYSEIEKWSVWVGLKKKEKERYFNFEVQQQRLTGQILVSSGCVQTHIISSSRVLAVIILINFLINL